VRGRRDDVEKLFLGHLETLKPDPGYLTLFRAIVLDAWQTEQARAKDIQRLCTKRVSELQKRSEQLDDAFIYARTIEHSVYERQRDRLQQELAVAELELQDARIDRIDVEGVLGFAEHLMANTARVWMEGTLSQRQHIQVAIFPEGLPFDGLGFGTAPTCLAFKQLRESTGSENGMASPPGNVRFFAKELRRSLRKAA